MSWTKLELIKMAYDEASLASYFFDLTPDQLISAGNKMDSMVANWDGGLCVRIGYPIASSPSTIDINEDTGIPDWANAPVYLNLAISICSGLGRSVPTELTMAARSDYKNMLNRIAVSNVMEYQLPSTMPRGAGSKYWRNTNNPFMPRPCDPVDAGPDGVLDLN